MKKNQPVKKKPERSCVICRNKFTKKGLIRIVRSKDGQIFYDPTGKANGRGAYICTSPDCLNTFLTKNVLERAFKQAVDAEVIAQIREAIQQDYPLD